MHSYTQQQAHKHMFALEGSSVCVHAPRVDYSWHKIWGCRTQKAAEGRSQERTHSRARCGVRPHERPWPHMPHGPCLMGTVLVHPVGPDPCKLWLLYRHPAGTSVWTLALLRHSLQNGGWALYALAPCSFFSAAVAALGIVGAAWRSTRLLSTHIVLLAFLFSAQVCMAVAVVIELQQQRPPGRNGPPMRWDLIHSPYTGMCLKRTWLPCICSSCALIPG